MQMNSLHRKVALIFALPLLVSVATGLIYRVGRYWFGMSSETERIIRGIHEGRYLGEMLSPVYVLLVGLGSLLLLATGAVLLFRRMSRLPPSRWRTQLMLHRVLAMCVAVPFSLTAISGIGYRLCQDWFDWSEEDAKWLMNLHQGTWLGPDLRAYYVLFLGMGLLALLATGLLLSGIFAKRTHDSSRQVT